MKSYFIIGTDTDCGKTYATCALMHCLQAHNHTVMALKPVASGCQEQTGQLVSDDALRLQAHNDDVTQSICPWPLRLPISPHLAAHADGVQLSAQAIVDYCKDKTCDSYDCLLIEGAGGLMVPLNETETWIDVLKKSQIPVILVVGMRLGCINHALLTMSVLEEHRMSCAGWIANCLDNDMLFLDDNIATLVNKIKAPMLGIIPYFGHFEKNEFMVYTLLA
ncbi:MAG: dethiobiotin synthase [Legionellaceae bacterium]|nr:dethiobiotin synthase [Legionellaceae bacterium]